MAEISKREQLIFDIAVLEWDMFQNVYNTGGRAACQDNPDTFFKMRMSQWMVYSDELLNSYMADCKEAVMQGRNLLFEKYARMMETTFAEEYNRVKEYLPEITEEKRCLAEQIVAVHLTWDTAMAEEYPHIRNLGRVRTTGEDNPLAGSSMESYLRGELLTYSDQTLKILWQETQKAQEEGQNLLKEIIRNETQFYGYESLEAAEKKYAAL